MKQTKPLSIQVTDTTTCNVPTSRTSKTQRGFFSNRLRTEESKDDALSSKRLHTQNTSPPRPLKLPKEHLFTTKLDLLKGFNQYSVDRLAQVQKQNFSNLVNGEGHFRIRTLIKNTSKQNLTKMSIKESSRYIKQLEIKRKNLYEKFKDNVENRAQTFLQFGFKSFERKDNYYVQEFLKQLNLNDMRFGSMGINDIWSQKQVKTFIEQSKFTTDKLLIQKYNKMLLKKIEQVMKESQEEMKRKQEEQISQLKQKNLSRRATKKIDQIRLENVDSAKISRIRDELSTIHQDNVKLFDRIEKDKKKLER